MKKILFTMTILALTGGAYAGIAVKQLGVTERIFTPAAPAPSPVAGSSVRAEKLLDCNFNFGTIVQIRIRRDVNGYSYQTLTNWGAEQKPEVLEESQWLKRDINFEFREERYRFFFDNIDRQWWYKAFPRGSQQPSVIGRADCD
jgi:hypothetical protein